MKLKNIVIVCVLTVFAVVYFKTTGTKPAKETPQVTEQKESVVSIVVDPGNGNKIEKQLDTDGISTAFDALSKLADDKTITIETVKYDFGIFVKSINGLVSDSKLSWIYFVNEKSGTVAADQYKISAGDKIEWKYIKPGE